MAKKELLSKLNLKDYNNELEQILEKKAFSSQVKNLLLSMFYKLETNYKDYATIKQDVLSKEALMEVIMNIIDTKCNQIELIDPKENETKKFWIVPEEGKIYCYQNESALLHSILEVGNKEFYIEDDYSTMRQAIQMILNVGYELNTKELLTNFDGWSWNNNMDKYDDLENYLVYQNLRILLGNAFLYEWKRDRRKKDYLIEVKKVSEEFWRGFCTFSILKASKDKKEKKYIEDELNKLKEQLTRMQDKDNFLKDIYGKKRKASNRIKMLDKILNDNELMKEEFLNRNSKLAQEEKIFSISDLEELIQKERKECIESLQECNNILEPKNYIEEMKNIEGKIELVENAKVGKVEVELLNLQKIFLQVLKQKIASAVTKKEIVELVYAYRYYSYLPIKKDGKIVLIKEVPELKQTLDEVAKKVITKACKLKALIIINQDINYNFQMMQKILDTKIINLEDILVIFTKSEEEIHIEVYESEIVDRTEIVPKEKEADFAIKFNKKIKLFM